ncbi:dihydrodipicolinate reductase [Mycobacteroides abscessus subsp. massiliense]|uniref:Dihydrodipicolinate reductase n=2 Tax=Mycobacteroides abscessus TaxID=36809 RepID=A0A0U0ZQG2_9MYCO|nr:dihydrodipicolinate reductase [Mycobacteroides abscessus]SKG07508.1 dihydrodipicolinate reductase [Mycobacteroides abscessus subsp. massiliense]SKS17603.1 dihydrodipicolinate reductase [Mycobacteroides abscessus subsp. abscessus]SKH25768.1 dihydrodipicolinate reductase [Mycobacteroides abscessus subsp. massiliense]SKI03877.1 dihydrodipicolinate reductase [Mycobacteroides abscessus subsp. massiliense]
MHRLVIWGPGEVGGAALRAAHASPDFNIVGVKVFSPHKHGRDAGELVGIGPIGVTATQSKQEILALDADCVILTPLPTSTMEGLDGDVIELLESGKNVVTTAAYHNVAQPNWFNTARTPNARLRAIAGLGVARNARERRMLAAIKTLTAIPALDIVTDPIFAPVADRAIPARATPERLMQACRTGNSSLHGTGVHPTFMVERQMIRLAAILTEVQHIRFVEALDFSRAPDGMWGGLHLLGFGHDIDEINDEFFLAKAGDFYYGDLTSNVGHALFGAHPHEVRIQRSLRAIPAKHDFQVSSTTIKKGTAAVLHMTHRGYLRDGRHFFTNEESWFLGVEHKFHGDNLPFGNLPDPGGYSFELIGKPATIRGQISYAANEKDLTAANPITAASVHALLDAVGPVCAAAPGVVIDDATPHYRTAEAR